MERLAAIERIVSICPTPNLLVVGDTNTRISETSAIEALGIRGELPLRLLGIAVVIVFGRMEKDLRLILLAISTVADLRSKMSGFSIRRGM